MRILFVGGGTLGSVTPLLAVAEELGREFEISNLKFEIRFWGTHNGPERELVEAAGIPFRSIPSGKLRRYWDLRNVFDAFAVFAAFWIALIRLLCERPSAVVGAGGFVQVPVMWAAWALRIPIVIHQQDARSGLANRLVAPFAARITAVFPFGTRAFGGRAIEIIGNPIRRSVLAAQSLDSGGAKRHFGFGGDRPVLLVLGGGTGAQALNDIVRSSLPSLLAHTDVIHVTGRGKMQNAECRMQNASYRSFALLTDDLPTAYAAADLVISRAGMGTISELIALQKSIVLVPMPDTHQEENAAAVAAAEAAVVWDQHNLTPEIFVARAVKLFAAVDERSALARAAMRLYPSNASTRLADIIFSAAIAKRI